MPKSFEHDGGSTLGVLYLKRVVFGRVLVGFKYGIARVLQFWLVLNMEFPGCYMFPVVVVVDFFNT